MPTFKTSRFVAVPPDIAFGVASDVGSYKTFLPLLERSTIRGPVTENVGIKSFSAELAVGYAKLGIREAFVSRVVCDEPRGTVSAASQDAPFRDMKTVWSIVAKPGGCEVTISIDYTMRNVLIQFAVSGAMDMAVQKVMTAFEARAKSVYNANKAS
jgi:coenzyme Q-binding protein COQ10